MGLPGRHAHGRLHRWLVRGSRCLRASDGSSHASTDENLDLCWAVALIATGTLVLFL
jgi:hypothetical protein